MLLPKANNLKTTIITGDEAVDEAVDEDKTPPRTMANKVITLRLPPILMKMLPPTKKVPLRVLLEAEVEVEVGAEEDGVEAEAVEVGEDEVNRVKMLPPLLLSKWKIKLNSKFLSTCDSNIVSQKQKSKFFSETTPFYIAF